jgi:hypothetical protein
MNVLENPTEKTTVENITLSLNNIKQLVDLNSDTINFDIAFTITSKNREPFDMLVVDQTTLDNNPSLEYKKVENGVISGSVRNDKNVYQNFFLLLKADNPCDCSIEIKKTELPKSKEQPQLLSPPAAEKSEGIPWGKIAIVFLVIGGLGYGLSLLAKKHSGSSSGGGGVGIHASASPMASPVRKLMSLN